MKIYLKSETRYTGIRTNFDKMKVFLHRVGFGPKVQITETGEKSGRDQEGSRPLCLINEQDFSTVGGRAGVDFTICLRNFSPVSNFS